MSIRAGNGAHEVGFHVDRGQGRKDGHGGPFRARRGDHGEVFRDAAARITSGLDDTRDSVPGWRDHGRHVGLSLQECPGGLVAARVGKVSLREKAGQAPVLHVARICIRLPHRGPVAFLHERARMLQVTDPAMPEAVRWSITVVTAAWKSGST